MLGSAHARGLKPPDVWRPPGVRAPPEGSKAVSGGAFLLWNPQRARSSSSGDSSIPRQVMSQACAETSASRLTSPARVSRTASDDRPPPYQGGMYADGGKRFDRPASYQHDAARTRRSTASPARAGRWKNWKPFTGAESDATVALTSTTTWRLPSLLLRAVAT